ncbi:hypothetical protein [Senimuribacter intestinalis]|uniref:hypothetical protein n=1 Tax=Senimuribacter intestinalis TaxID=2941507 RepID=UPI00203E6C91|nr:hypothetical protein [Senimuribacter intestinalis]
MARKKEVKKATLESLIERAQQRKEAKADYKEYFCETIGETLLIKKLPLTRICEILDMYETDTMKEAMELNSQVIYESVPLLQKRELQDAYECIEPYDIVVKLLDENMGEIEKLCKTILAGYGMAELADDIKN